MYLCPTRQKEKDAERKAKKAAYERARRARLKVHRDAEKERKKFDGFVDSLAVASEAQRQQVEAALTTIGRE